MENQLQIGEVAKLIGRSIHTIRVWGYDKRLPEHLRPTRNSRGWRVWSPAQVEAIKQWIIDEDMTPGKAFRRNNEN
jgi:DNA-binding transcriptional MerR regulator